VSLLSAARAIAATEPLEEYGGVYSCVYCRACRHSNQAFAPVSQHADDCPWLAMPKIVAALEAAQAASECLDEGVRTVFKGVCIENARYLLRTALKGES
jgi:hypothetical protein